MVGDWTVTGGWGKRLSSGLPQYGQRQRVEILGIGIALRCPHAARRTPLGSFVSATRGGDDRGDFCPPSLYPHAVREPLGIKSRRSHGSIRNLHPAVRRPGAEH